MTHVAIIGAGMAGSSLAYHLAPNCRVTLLEAEDHPGFHTTGRSAALYAKGYGNTTIRDLTVASEAFYVNPPELFGETPLLAPRGALFVARPDQRNFINTLMTDIQSHVPTARIIDATEAIGMVPLLNEDYLDCALLDDDSRDMDVALILQGYLRGAQQAGAKLLCEAQVLSLSSSAGTWQILTSKEQIEADIVVNAAGAWADSIAELASLRPLGIQPKRRTAFLVDTPANAHSKEWPVILDVEETFYLKPEAGMLLCSPADETPSPPMDAYPEDIDIAIAVDRIQKVMNLPVTRIGRSWAGLRSFAADKTPVMGFDPDASGFFWLAGQGGYGIQTAPGMAQLAAALITGKPCELEIDASGLAHAMRPGRLRS